MHEVRLATPADRLAMGETLTRAFADDPIWRWLVPDDDRWHAKAPAWFLADVTNRMKLEHVYTIPGVHGVCQWQPPGQYKPTAADFFGVVGPSLALFRGDTVRALRYLARMEKAHPHEPDHWYLAMIGTDPDHQGKGIGSALMKPILDRCDREETPAYLESSKESNIAFYARYGFELRDPLLTENGPTIYPMWRDPRS